MCICVVCVYMCVCTTVCVCASLCARVCVYAPRMLLLSLPVHNTQLYVSPRLLQDGGSVILKERTERTSHNDCRFAGLCAAHRTSLVASSFDAYLFSSDLSCLCKLSVPSASSGALQLSPIVVKLSAVTHCCAVLRTS